MEIALPDAQALLPELVRRAAAGEEVVLTEGGRPVARLSPVAQRTPTPEEKRALVRRIRAAAPPHDPSKPDSARSQDFLYGEDGLPA